MGRIKPIGFDPDDGIQMLIYGRSGTGKTTFAGSFPGRILWMVCSGGNNPGELRSLNTPANRGKISQATLEKAEDVLDVTAHLRVNPGEFSTVVLDHASGLQDMILGEIIGRPVPEQKSWGLASQQQYGQATVRCKEVIRALLNLKCNVVIVAQERSFGNSEEAADNPMVMPTIGAGLMPQLAAWLNTAVDYICNTFIKQRTVTKELKIGQGEKVVVSTREEIIKGQVDFCLRTAPHPIFTTKFRMPKGYDIPEFITDPDYSKIIELIQGSRGE